MSFKAWKPWSLKKLLFYLFAFAILMFGFSFALIPLYNVLCKATGLNGKWEITQANYKRYRDPEKLSAKRTVIVEFDVTRNSNLQAIVEPQHPTLQVIPGELALTSYKVKNLANKTIVVQAIPSISPGQASSYLKKLECFCFTPQTLLPGEIKDLPLRFWLEPELPEAIHRLTLSYTLFDVTAQTQSKQ